MEKKKQQSYRVQAPKRFTDMVKDADMDEQEILHYLMGLFFALGIELRSRFYPKKTSTKEE